MLAAEPSNGMPRAFVLVMKPSMHLRAMPDEEGIALRCGCGFCAWPRRRSLPHPRGNSVLPCRPAAYHRVFPAPSVESAPSSRSTTLSVHISTELHDTHTLEPRAMLASDRRSCSLLLLRISRSLSTMQWAAHATTPLLELACRLMSHLSLIL